MEFLELFDQALVFVVSSGNKERLAGAICFVLLLVVVVLCALDLTVLGSQHFCLGGLPYKGITTK